MAISAYILKIVEKDPLLRLQIRAKEKFNRHQYVVFTKKILHGFVSFCISLIFMYCLFTEKKLFSLISPYINTIWTNNFNHVKYKAFSYPQSGCHWGIQVNSPLRPPPPPPTHTHTHTHTMDYRTFLCYRHHIFTQIIWERKRTQKYVMPGK